MRDDRCRRNQPLVGNVPALLLSATLPVVPVDPLDARCRCQVSADDVSVQQSEPVLSEEAHYVEYG